MLTCSRMHMGANSGMQMAVSDIGKSPHIAADCAPRGALPSVELADDMPENGDVDAGDAVAVHVDVDVGSHHAGRAPGGPHQERCATGMAGAWVRVSRKVEPELSRVWC